MWGPDRVDAAYWTNFTPTAHPAEVTRTHEIIPDPAKARALLEYGFRPFGTMDYDPYVQPVDLRGPWEPTAADLSAEPILVDIQTGWRFLHHAKDNRLELDLKLSDNYLDAQELLLRASTHSSPFVFRKRDVCCREHLGVMRTYPLVSPLELDAGDVSELSELIEALQELFCTTCGAQRLWFRGQRNDFLVERSQEITSLVYGVPFQSSLHPSLGRYAKHHPGEMGYAFAKYGPNRRWIKPFLIWMMRANGHWFANEPECLKVLGEVLIDECDERFGQLLGQIQSSGFFYDDQHLRWPDQADDLRQWFFVFMKHFEFGVTLQQYGYCTSLLDVTEDVDVALYFTQSRMLSAKMCRMPPQKGRIIYVFAERDRADFFQHGVDLFWGTDGWSRTLPPRLSRQRAGFVAGSTNRTQNFYADMIIAIIRLDQQVPETTLTDEDLFPPPEEDLLYATLRESRPYLDGLY